MPGAQERWGARSRSCESVRAVNGAWGTAWPRVLLGWFDALRELQSSQLRECEGPGVAFEVLGQREEQRRWRESSWTVLKRGHFILHKAVLLILLQW